MPGARGGVVAQAPAVDVPDHGDALRAAGPVAAGAILAGRKRAAFRGRSGQHVVPVWRKADPRNGEAALRQRRGDAKLVVVAVQVIDARRDGFAFEVLPRTFADAVARVDGRLAVGRLRTEVGVPGFCAGAMALRQCLTVPVRAF